MSPKPKIDKSDEDYHYEATCPEHRKKSTDFIGQTERGYVFRCRYSIAINSEIDGEAHIGKIAHTFLAKSVNCYRTTAIKGKGSLRTEVWTWTEGNPKPAADVNWKVVNL
jgi:hypothetical protein